MATVEASPTTPCSGDTDSFSARAARHRRRAGPCGRRRTRRDTRRPGPHTVYQRRKLDIAPGIQCFGRMSRSSHSTAGGVDSLKRLPDDRWRNNMRPYVYHRPDRRDFLKSSLLTAGGVGADAQSRRRQAGQQATPLAGPPRIQFAAIGMNHAHINGQVESVIRGGGQLVSFFAKEPDLDRDVRQAVSAGEAGEERGRRFSRTRRSSSWSAPRSRANARRSASASCGTARTSWPTSPA